VVVGTGSYLPERVVTNDDIEAMVLDFDRPRGLQRSTSGAEADGAVQLVASRLAKARPTWGTRAAQLALQEAKMTARHRPHRHGHDHERSPRAAFSSAGAARSRYISAISAARFGMLGFAMLWMVADGLLDRLGRRPHS